MIDFNNLPDCALLRMKQLIPPLGPVPLAASSIRRKLVDETFPPPVRLSEGITCWRWGDVRQWLEKQYSERKAA